MNGNTEEVEEEPEACAPDIVEAESDPVVETIVKVKKGRKKCTAQKNNDLQSILANICSEEQIEEISKLIAESNTKEELHNSLFIFLFRSGVDIIHKASCGNDLLHERRERLSLVGLILRQDEG